MLIRTFICTSPVNLLLIGLLILPACNTPARVSQPAQVAAAPATLPPTSAARPEWFDMKMTDVQTGQTFTINDYAGKVVLLETLAMWCPTCLLQSGQVQKLHRTLGNPADLISVTLDVDSNEDAAALKDYASSYGLDWHFAVAPLLVERALGNLYNAEYLNPPLSPMLIIDRAGNVHQLPYGLKETAALQKLVEPYLAK